MKKKCNLQSVLKNPSLQTANVSINITCKPLNSPKTHMAGPGICLKWHALMHLLQKTFLISEDHFPAHNLSVLSTTHKNPPPKCSYLKLKYTSTSHNHIIANWNAVTKLHIAHLRLMKDLIHDRRIGVSGGLGIRLKAVGVHQCILLGA